MTGEPARRRRVGAAGGDPPKGPAGAGHRQRPPAPADPGVAEHAHGLRQRGAEVRLQTTVQAATAQVVDPYLTVPAHPELFAAGDAAAVPDLTRPGQLTAMTAQHAQRQGRRAAANLAASLGRGHRHPYRHHDLGFVVDLGGAKAAANPLRVPLSGLAAKAVTRGYHLAVIPANRVRVAADWLLDAVLPRQTVQLGLVRGPAVPLGSTAAAADGGAASRARPR
jgi:NADH:ubiquinone reductase (H+-translocating)